LKKNIFLYFLLFAGSPLFSQTFQSNDNAFRFNYPKKVTPVVIPAAQPIKDATDTLDIQSASVNPAAMDSIPDDCYNVVKVFVTKSGVKFSEYECDQGAAGTMYYNYLYTTQKNNYRVILKFTVPHCNACADDQGNTIPYDEKKETAWFTGVLESLKFNK
jgi:hypothetical protein